MRIAYFDCPMGASGDMVLGALIDAGLEGAQLAEALAGLKLPGYELRWESVMKGPFAATQVSVAVSDTTTERHLADVRALLDAAEIPDDVRAGAKAVFRRLAEVCELYHSKGLRVIFHSDGDIRSMIPGLIGAGVDALAPIDTTAGLDLADLKAAWVVRSATAESRRDSATVAACGQ